MLHQVANSYAVLDPWFGGPPRPVEFDMGCGFGRYTLDLARRFPDRLVLGSDFSGSRMRKLEKRAQVLGLANVELLYAHSLELVGYLLPDGCVNRLHLLCPDPWPKSRHRGRRLVTCEFLSHVARILAPGGVLHFSTDHPPYLDDVRAMVASVPFFQSAPEAIADVQDLKTDFERIWNAQGKHVPHLACLRSVRSGEVVSLTRHGKTIAELRQPAI